MGGCLARCYFCVLPASEAHTENVCDRQDLTEYEAKCFVSLRRCAAVVLFVFFINLGITIWVNVAGNVATADFILDLITCIPILMQVRFSIMISVTDKGLQLGWIQALRLIIFFFLLMNVVRLYVKVQQTSFSCTLADEAFKTPGDDKPKDIQCEGYVIGPLSVSIIMYVVATLLKLGIIQRIEFSYLRRYMRKQWERRAEPLLGEQGMVEVTRGDSTASDNNI